MSKQHTNTRGYATMGEACAYLAISATTLRRRIADGTITAYRFGTAHTLRFKWDDLDAALRPLAIAGGAR